MKIFKFFLTLVSMCLSFNSNAYWGLSFVNLLAEPKKYENKSIAVMGYVKFLPITKIFLSKDHAILSDTPSSIIVEDMTQKGDMGVTCKEDYVIVYGRWTKLGGSYGISHIDKIVLADGVKRCWTKEQGNIYPDGIVPNENPN